MQIRSRTFAVAALLAVTALAAACSSGASASPTTTPSIRPSPSGSVTSPDPNRERDHPDPNFDFGFTVRITDQGFHPQWLVSLCCKPVTWINDTNAPVSVVFDHQLVRSGQIAPGGTFVWKPKNVQSVTYHDADDPGRHGVIQVNQTIES
jgi:hypothetical protein